MQSRCRAVLFDMDDVLCAYHWRARVEALARLSGQSFDALDAAIWRSGFEDAADAGAMTAEAYLEGFAARLGMPFTRAQWVANRKAAMEPWPEMLALAAELKAAGIAIAVVTDNGALTGEAMDELFPQLRPLFGKAIFVSAQMQLRKPDPTIYRAVCDAMGVPPSETFFTDDLAENVEGARRAGLVACQFTGEPAMRLALRQAGVPL